MRPLTTAVINLGGCTSVMAVGKRVRPKVFPDRPRNFSQCDLGGFLLAPPPPGSSHPGIRLIFRARSWDHCQFLSRNRKRYRRHKSESSIFPPGRNCFRISTKIPKKILVHAIFFPFFLYELKPISAAESACSSVAFTSSENFPPHLRHKIALIHFPD